MARKKIPTEDRIIELLAELSIEEQARILEEVATFHKFCVKLDKGLKKAAELPLFRSAPE